MGRGSRFALGVLIIFWLTFFWRQIIGGEVWYCCDNLLINIPSKVFLAGELVKGRFPLWNPYLFSGTPFLADINLSVLHPLNLLYLILPPFRALTVGILVLFLVGLAGMYILGRTFRLGRFASVAGAIVFGFSGSLIVYANNVPILQVAVLVPWVLAMWIRYLNRPTGKRFVTFVIMSAFQIFSGHPQFTYYTWLILGAYTFVLPKGSLINRWMSLAKAAFLTALLTSVQTLPFLAFAFSSTRQGQSAAFSAIDSVHPLSLIRLVLPGVVGDLSRGTAWIQTGSMHGYVGLLPLLLIPIAWKRRVGKFFIVVAVVSLVLSIGRYTPVYGLAYHFIPGMQWFREPSQFLFLWSFGIACGMMVAADILVKKSERVRYIFTISIILMLAASVLYTENKWLWEQMTLLGFLPDRLLAKFAALPWSQRGIISEGLLTNVSLFGALGILAALAIGRLRSSMVAKIVVLGVLFVDLYVYGQTNVTTIAGDIPRGWQEETRARIASWKLSTDDNYRYYTDPTVYPYPGKVPFGQFNDPGESLWQLRILRPSTGMLYGLSAVDGYASMVSSSYQRRFDESSRNPTGVTISSIVDPTLGAAGVRYIITKPNNPLLADTKQYRLLTVDEKSAVYENTKAVPVSRVTRQPLEIYIVGSVLTLAGLAWCLREYSR